MPERPTTDPWDRLEDSLDTLIPANANQPYDMHRAIEAILDPDPSALEVGMFRCKRQAETDTEVAALLVGVSFGVLAAPVMGAGAAIVMSAVVFAGSSQFAALAVLASGGGAGSGAVSGAVSGSALA